MKIDCIYFNSENGGTCIATNGKCECESTTCDGYSSINDVDIKNEETLAE